MSRIVKVMMFLGAVDGACLAVIYVMLPRWYFVGYLAFSVWWLSANVVEYLTTASRERK